MRPHVGPKHDMAVGTRSVPDERCQWPFPGRHYNAKHLRTSQITFAAL
jgi:hypothetical protein